MHVQQQASWSRPALMPAGRLIRQAQGHAWPLLVLLCLLVAPNSLSSTSRPAQWVVSGWQLQCWDVHRLTCAIVMRGVWAFCGLLDSCAGGDCAVSSRASPRFSCAWPSSESSRNGTRRLPGCCCCQLTPAVCPDCRQMASACLAALPFTCCPERRRAGLAPSCTASTGACCSACRGCWTSVGPASWLTRHS